MTYVGTKVGHVQSSEPNVQELPANKAVVLACNFVHAKDYPPNMERFMPRLLEPKPGSVKRDCRVCLKQIWVGPAQQQTLLKRPDAWVCCFVCAIKVAHGPINLVAASKEGHLYDESKPN